MQLRASPSWGGDCSPVYEFARQLKELTGWDWHVDHIIPLQGENVCGLHIPQNLQVVPALLNQRKHNKLVTETGTCSACR